MINDAHNSSFENNCEFRLINKKKVFDRKICLYTIKDIKKGEELFASYGEDYWLTRKN